MSPLASLVALACVASLAPTAAASFASVQQAFVFAAAPALVSPNDTAVAPASIQDDLEPDGLPRISYRISEDLGGYLEHVEPAVGDHGPEGVITYQWASPDPEHVVGRSVGGARVVVFPASEPTIAVEAEDSVMTDPTPLGPWRDLCVALVTRGNSKRVVVRSEQDLGARDERCGGTFALAVDVARRV